MRVPSPPARMTTFMDLDALVSESISAGANIARLPPPSARHQLIRPQIVPCARQVGQPLAFGAGNQWARKGAALVQDRVPEFEVTLRALLGKQGKKATDVRQDSFKRELPR